MKKKNEKNTVQCTSCAKYQLSHLDFLFLVKSLVPSAARVFVFVAYLKSSPWGKVVFIRLSARIKCRLHQRT